MKRELTTQPTWASNMDNDAYGLYADLVVKNVRQRFRWIEAGEFWMGSPAREQGRYKSEILHKVRLTQGFWLADTACTQALWKAVMGENPSYFKGDDLPVERVSWNDTKDFIKKLNSLIEDLNLRLPTDAEWEYACRAGTETPFAYGEKADPQLMNFNGNINKVLPVARLYQNDWGLFQMHGNVFEWCEDWYGEYKITSEITVDPRGPNTGSDRVLRGGLWTYSARYCRSAYRRRAKPTRRSRGRSYSFRLVSGHQVNKVTEAKTHWYPTTQKPIQPTWASNINNDAYGLYADLVVKNVKQRFRWVEAGEFWMGSPENEEGRCKDEIFHKVRLTQGFWLADTACTQALWETVMGESPGYSKGDDLPVGGISWEDTKDFIRKLNGLVEGLNLRLPTEAEWEYACRAGTETPFAYGEKPDSKLMNFNTDIAFSYLT